MSIYDVVDIIICAGFLMCIISIPFLNDIWKWGTKRKKRKKKKYSYLELENIKERRKNYVQIMNAYLACIPFDRNRNYYIVSDGGYGYYKNSVMSFDSSEDNGYGIVEFSANCFGVNGRAEQEETNFSEAVFLGGEYGKRIHKDDFKFIELRAYKYLNEKYTLLNKDNDKTMSNNYNDSFSSFMGRKLQRTLSSDRWFKNIFRKAITLSVVSAVSFILGKRTNGKGKTNPKIDKIIDKVSDKVLSSIDDEEKTDDRTSNERTRRSKD